MRPGGCEALTERSSPGETAAPWPPTDAGGTVSPGSPMTTSTAPTGATSPSATKIRSTVPAYGEGMSTVVLSVWISTSGSSSAISWPSATSHRLTSPSVRPSPRSGSLNDLAMSGDCREADRGVRQHRVDALRAVHELGDTQVDDDARERQRLTSAEAMLALHEVEHSLDRDRRSLVEILVEPEREPPLRSPRNRPLQPEVVANRECENRPLHGSLDRELRYLAVALRSVPVSRREVRSVHGDRQVERRPGDEPLAVDVPAAPARRRRGVDTGLVGRHPDDAEERVERHLVSGVGTAGRRVRVERP